MRVMTFDKTETDKVYVPKNLYNYMKGLKPVNIQRCEYCKNIVNNTHSHTYRNSKICSIWCLEMVKYYKKPTSKNILCKYCKGEKGEVILYYRTYRKKNGELSSKSTGVYSKVCNVCKAERKTCKKK